MARTNGPTSDGELEWPSRAGARALDEDSGRMIGADEVARPVRDDEAEAGAESPFLRKPKRVPARKTALPSRKTAQKLKLAITACAFFVAVAICWVVLQRYGERSWRFRIESSDQIEVAGNHNVTRQQVVEVFGADIARNIFAVPLEDRKKQLEQVPWVESATLMRLLPNRLRVQVKERTPVALVQIGSRVSLIDSQGVVMEPPANGEKFSFPVITGMTDTDPLSTRAPRMKIYAQLMTELEADGARYSQDIEEVDLADPDDVKVFVKDPQGGVLVHLGASNFLDRYKIYIANVAKWRGEYGQIRSVDLRYERQVIVNPDGVPESPAAAQSSAAQPKSVAEAKPKKASRSKWRRHRARH